MTQAPGTKLDRVLVVDDDDMVREVLITMARELSTEVEAAASGQMALDAIAAKSFDLLITDMRMPEVDGLDLVRLARDRYPALRVLVVTGFAGLEEERALEELGAVLLRKPFGAGDFRRAVSQVLAG